ncbi:MAG TPA: DUF3606 domain-containing protein [Daejeonella sp.]
MSDNKDLQGQQDRSRVAGNEEYEVRYIAEKMGVSTEMVEKAIAEVGNNRAEIEEFIKGASNKSK